MELMEIVECVLPDWTREHCENYLALMKINVRMELLGSHKDILEEYGWKWTCFSSLVFRSESAS
jgi:hypothetical protein